MSPGHPQAAASSLRVEYERINAEYESRKGPNTKAIEYIQRLLEELEQEYGITLIPETDQENAVETFKCMQRMLESQNDLIHGLMEHIEREAVGAILTPPHSQSSVVQQQQQQSSPLPRPKRPSRLRQSPATPTRPVRDNTATQPTGLGIQQPSPPEASYDGLLRGSFTNGIVETSPSPTVAAASGYKYKPWPTANPYYSRPALKPITFKMERDMPPRLPGDMSGAVHIRRQLDEQEEAVEQARTHKWLEDLGQHRDDEGDDPGPRGQKRRAEDELGSPPGKRTKVSRLRGGNDNDVSAGLRRLFSSLNPFKRRELPGTRSNCFVNNGSDDEGPRNADSTNEDRGGGALTPPPEELPPGVPPPVIVMESLRDAFGDGEDDMKARRYRDWFASLIALAESTPGSITAPGFLARCGQRKKFERLKTALGHMSIRPFEKRQAAQRRIKSLEGSLRRCGEAAGKLADMEPAAEWEAKKRQEGLEECYGKMGRDATTLEEEQSKLASQVALEEKIFVGGVEHGDCFLSWITKTRNNVCWELGFAGRTREKPERIRVGRQTYYSV